MGQIDVLERETISRIETNKNTTNIKRRMWSIDRRRGENGGRVSIWGATITIWGRIIKGMSRVGDFKHNIYSFKMYWAARICLA